MSTATDQITKLITVIGEIPNKVITGVNQSIAAQNVEIQRSLMLVESKINELSIAISKLENKPKSSKKTETAAQPAQATVDGAQVPQATVVKPAINNILAYFKQQYENDEDFKTKYHCKDFADITEKSEEYIKKTTAEAKRKYMCQAMYNYITKGTADVCKQLNIALKAQFETYKKTANPAPVVQNLTIDPPSPQ